MWKIKKILMIDNFFFEYYFNALTLFREHFTVPRLYCGGKQNRRGSLQNRTSLYLT
jgi:hypothetical protein